MISPEEIRKLATLSRIAVDDTDVASFAEEIESILGYVGKINAVETSLKNNEASLINVLREDGEPHETALYTSAILKEAPERKGDYVVVKKILGS